MTDSQNLSQRDWQQQEDVIAQFEEAFQQGNAPNIENYLLQEGTDRFLLLVELVNTDLEQRLKAGKTVLVEEYLDRFSELNEIRETVQELIAAEYALRLRTSSPPDLSEYARRFPQLGESLISHLQRISTEDQQHQSHPAAHAKTIIRSEDSTQSQIAEKSTLPPIDASEQIPSQKQYGRYAVKRLLGAGAFGQVFLALDPKTKRNVALKVPHRQLHPGSEEDERFLREARAVAALQHQHICPLFDLLETDDRIILVMPYVDGGSLADKIKQSRFSLNKSIRLVRILASAMAYAHEAGVVHRDLKPANILIDEKHSKPVITDFGLALRSDNNETTLTQKGQLLGTPAYMSPEQASGENEKVGAVSDIYSLGMILYELCTGQLPFTGSLTQVLGQIVNKEPPIPSSLNADIAPKLEQIILKSIAKKPEDRFSSMKEFAAALKRLQAVDNKNKPGKSAIDQRKSNNTSKQWIIAGIALLFLSAGSWTIFKPSLSEPKLTETDSQKTAISVDSKIHVPTERVDLLKEIQLPDDGIVGDWTLSEDGLKVNPKPFSRITIPISVEDDYQLDLELTRKWGDSEINVVIPVGNRSCMFSLGRDDWCGLQNVYAHEFGRVIQGHFPNNQRHHLTLIVSATKQQAYIKAKLNGVSILDWNGSVDALTTRSGWQIPAKTMGLGAHYDRVIFHKLSLLVKKGTKIFHRRWVKLKTDKYRDWQDLLDSVDVSQQTFTGTWKLIRSLPDAGSDKRDKRFLSIRGGEFSRLILPVIPTGDYQLQVHMQRTARTGEVNLILPVGKAICMVSGGNDGSNFSIQNVNGEYWGVRKRGLLVNGKPHIIDVNITLGEEETATILLTIDQQEIFNWHGKQSELSLQEDWVVHPVALALGVACSPKVDPFVMRVLLI